MFEIKDRKNRKIKKKKFAKDNAYKEAGDK